MTTDLLLGILASVIATAIVGTTAYKFIVNKKLKNNGIIQSEGNNQLALQKSKNNTISIGGNSPEYEKNNRTE